MRDQSLVAQHDQGKQPFGQRFGLCAAACQQRRGGRVQHDEVGLGARHEAADAVFPAQRLGGADGSTVREFQTLLRRMSMRTSARNQFVGAITGLREGEVSFEVRLRLDDASELVAVITRASAENLELAIGKEAIQGSEVTP